MNFLVAILTVYAFIGLWVWLVTDIGEDYKAIWWPITLVKFLVKTLIQAIKN